MNKYHISMTERSINFSAWRNRGILYRLEGTRYENGEVSLQARPTAPKPKPDSEAVQEFNEMFSLNASESSPTPELSTSSK